MLFGPYPKIRGLRNCVLRRPNIVIIVARMA